MKKTILTLSLFLAISSFVHAQVSQWTTSGANIYYNTGNVGIGNSAPTAKLTVFSTIPLGSSPMNSVLVSSIGSKAGTSNDFKSNVWLVRNSSGNDWLSARLHDGISVDGSFMSPQIDTRTWWERDPSKDIQSWGNAANTYLTINKGNIGIGITTPSSKLDVNGDIAVGSTGYLSSIRLPANDYTNLFLGASLKDNGDGTYTVFGDGASNYFNAIRMDNGASNNGGVYNNAGAINFYAGFTVNGSNYSVSNSNLSKYLRMTVGGNGNVGIGIPNPQNKLDVNGTIHSKEVKIDLSGWGDYVFKKEYQLRSLSEVKAYIDQNLHLPEIPSEQEMVKNGLNVSEMNKLLMKKVEELTLYLIEKDQNEKKQELTNQELKNQIVTLRLQLETLTKAISDKQK